MKWTKEAKIPLKWCICSWAHNTIFTTEHRFHIQCRWHARITWLSKSEYAFSGCLLKSTDLYSIAWCWSNMYEFIFDSVIHDSKYRSIHFAMHNMHNVLATVKPHQMLTTLYFVINLGASRSCGSIQWIGALMNEHVFTIEKMLKFAFVQFEMLQFAIWCNIKSYEVRAFLTHCAHNSWIIKRNI